jgi:iron(III) transport system ATP-binding protein
MMSVNIIIRNAKKAYGDTVIIPNLSLDIKEGELFTLLGPSGCGKTTLLRMIAGFNSIEGGDFYFNDKRINDLDPAKRNIGMVFQNYAIFPHFTVRKNIEFGLKNKKLLADEISSTAEEYMKLVQIEQFANRMPEKLSGGQQQRVALARALCIKPDVLLMDEPLSNLDAKLRVEMRTVIKRIQNSVGITCVYVTHDQEEAMAISDRIAIMNAGVIQQIGRPKAIYQRPANLFVATFIGRTNILDGKLVVEEGKAYLEVQEFKTKIQAVAKDHFYSQDVKISIRPEEFFLNREDVFEGVKGVVKDAIFLGLNTHYFVVLNSGEEVEIIQESTIEETLEKGTKISLGINTVKTNVFTADGKQNILTGVLTDHLAQSEEA